MGTVTKSSMVCDLFSEIAPKYDYFNKLASFGIYRRWLKHVAACANAQHSTRMLDIAAGTGDVTFEIAQKARPSHIYATDFCEEMLHVARKRYESGESSGVPIDFQRVDAMELPFGDESFDLVTVAYGLRNFDDRQCAMQEASRVLVPNGRYVALEFSTPQNAVWRSVYHLYLNHIVPAVGSMLTKEREGFEYLRDSIKQFPAAEIIKDELLNCGFSSVTSETHTGGIVTIYTATK